MLDWLPENVSTFGGAVDALFFQIYYLTNTVLILVFSTLLYFLVTFRARPGHKARYLTGNTRLEVVWTAVTLTVMVVLALVSGPTWANIKERPVSSPDGFTAQIVGKQYNWVMRYPGPDGMLATGDDLELENELYVPVDTDVWILLSAEDVIHSFFVPQFRLKQDLVPGREIPAWFQATRPGTYEIACAELCGFGHSTMRGWVHVLSKDDYADWVVDTLRPSEGVR